MTYTSVTGAYKEIDPCALDAFNPKEIEEKTKDGIIDINLTGIVCTIGPKCESKDTLKEMLQAGMRIARLNFSHGSHEAKAKMIQLLKELRNETGRPFAIALDTKGPEIRTGDLKNGNVIITKDSEVIVSNDKEKFGECSPSFIYFDFPNIQALETGVSIYIDDGLLQLKIVEKIDAKTIKCIAQNEGELGSRKGVNLPNVETNLPAMTETDKKDLKFGVEQDLDMIFASFIRNAKHVAEMRDYLKECGAKEHIFIITKIENHEGIKNFDEILEASDGIMAARGDMGIETMLETVPIKQKIMARKCNEAKKPFIVATQMLESMCNNPRATRAEVYDVNGAILDGASCVMLSGESAKGKYPLLAVKTQSTIAKSVEKYISQIDKCSNALPKHPAEWLAECSDARFIISMECGSCGKIPTLKNSVPNIPVAYLTTNPKRAYEANLNRGMLPKIVDASKIKSSDYKTTVIEMLKEGILALKTYSYCDLNISEDENIVMLCSCPGSYQLSVIKAKDFNVDPKNLK